MRPLFFIAILLPLLQLHAGVIPAFVEDEVKARLDTMSCLVTIDDRGEEVILSYLNRYLMENRDRSERILGRSLIFFPEIEDLLSKHNMPDELKYLAVVESALYPEALSRVGAAGIWQFMKETGRGYGLEVNTTVDERYQLTKATLAAIEYLRKKHERFGNWALALAAYNSGAGRVSRAIKRGRSKNFWRIRRYLPRETRNYVPAFIAATYLFMYYEEHGLQPETPSLDLQLTDQITVYQSLSFGRIAQLTGLDLETIAFLNPAYRRGYIPASRRGYPLVLPRRVILAVADYLALQAKEQRPLSDLSSSGFRQMPTTLKQTRGENDYLQIIYVWSAHDSPESVAAMYGCRPFHLLSWNKIKHPENLKPGMEITLYLPAYQLRYNPYLHSPLKKISHLPLQHHSARLNTKAPRIPPRLSPCGKYYCYELPHSMSLLHLAHFYGNLHLEQLVALNQLQPNQLLPKGTVIKIRKIENTDK